MTKLRTRVFDALTRPLAVLLSVLPYGVKARLVAPFDQRRYYHTCVRACSGIGGWLLRQGAMFDDARFDELRELVWFPVARKDVPRWGEHCPVHGDDCWCA